MLDSATRITFAAGGTVFHGRHLGHRGGGRSCNVLFVSVRLQ